MDQALETIVAQAIERLLGGLRSETPEMAQPLSDWMHALAGGHAPQAYFAHPLAFPTLQLPWWVAQSLGHASEPALQADLVYSSINGYYFIRMIDNVMDGEATVEAKLLPALAWFHTEFQSVYQARFTPTHPFWALYRRVWLGTAEAAVHDARLGQITLAMFEQASARKVGAALIPVAAVCHHHGRPDLIAPWSEMVHRLGKWHQMLNDSFDWHKDSRHGNMTHFLSEAERLRQPNESAVEWIVRRGFGTACTTLRRWMGEAQATAARLGSPALEAYLVGRSAQFEQRAASALAGLEALGRLAAVTR